MVWGATKQRHKLARAVTSRVPRLGRLLCSRRDALAYSAGPSHRRRRCQCRIWKRDFAASRRAAELEQRHRISERLYPGLANAEIVARIDRHFLDATSEGQCRNENLNVRSPSVSGDEWLVAVRLNQLTNQRDAIKPERAERIA